MKAVLIAFLIMVCPVFASELRLATVKQPVYLAETGFDPSISIVDVPFVTRNSDPGWRFNAICEPLIPATDGSWRKPADVNLTSIYGITVAGTYTTPGKSDIEVVIDCSAAKRPEGYPFTLEQVLDTVVTCVRLMYPPVPENEGKFEIRIIRESDTANRTKEGSRD